MRDRLARAIQAKQALIELPSANSEVRGKGLEVRKRHMTLSIEFLEGLKRVKRPGVFPIACFSFLNFLHLVLLGAVHCKSLTLRKAYWSLYSL